MDVVDALPIVSPKNNRFKRDYHREIAWTIDYRGDNDDVPALLFVGAGYTLVKKVFLTLFGNGSVLFSGFRLYHDYYPYQLQGKAWIRIAVEMRNFNSDFMSLEDFGLIVERNIKKTCLCNIKYVKLNKFLNL